MNIEDILKILAGKAGRVIDQVGKATGNILPETGWTERAEAAGAEPLTTQQRIETSLKNTGAIAEGDYATAAAAGNPYAASRADGGILTTPQATANYSAVDSYLKSQGVTDLSTLNPVQKTEYDRLKAAAEVPGGAGDPTGEALARAAFEAAVRQANDFRAGGQRTFQTLLDSIKAFRDRAQTGFANAGQEILNTSSENLGSNARTAQEQEGQLRSKGRALGLGDSSKFLQQTGLAQRLASTQGNTLATKGENDRANRLNLDKNLDLAQTNENEANDYIKDVNAKADAVESAGVNNFGTALNNILNYSRQVAALNPSSVTDVQPDFSGIVNTLNTITGGISPTVGGAPDNSGASLANPTTLADILKRQRGIYA